MSQRDDARRLAATVELPNVGPINLPINLMVRRTNL